MTLEVFCSVRYGGIPRGRHIGIKRGSSEHGAVTCARSGRSGDCLQGHAREREGVGVWTKRVMFSIDAVKANLHEMRVKKKKKKAKTRPV